MYWRFVDKCSGECESWCISVVMALVIVVEVMGYKLVVVMSLFCG